MKKIERMYRRALKDEPVKLLEFTNHHGHFNAVLEHADGRVQRVNMSGSPTNEDFAVTAFIYDVRRFARGAR